MQQYLDFLLLEQIARITLVINHNFPLTVNERLHSTKLINNRDFLIVYISLFCDP